MSPPALALVVAVAAAFTAARAQDPTPRSHHISGRAVVENGEQSKADHSIRVFSVPLHTRADGRVVPASKQSIFRAARAGHATAADDRGKFSLEVSAGSHSVFAFVDTDGDGIWDPGTPEPFGWYASQPAGRWAPIAAETDQAIEFTLRAPTHFAKATKHSAHGTLRHVHDYPVLHLRGDAAQRGFAHGELIAPQIVDFFREYVLEDKLRSAQTYQNGFEKFLGTHFALPAEFVTECEAVIQGMRASGANLRIPELNRDFSLTDLYAINAYIETRAMRESCTQFAAWGDRTAGTDVDGGMVTGRNMDGECDIRKVTVSHFLLFAVEPESTPDAPRKRWVSMMWPGFVGTISGLNEDGFYTMENAGGTGPGPVVDKLVPISWTMRDCLARLGADATPASVQALFDEYDNAAGGSCGPGCITLFATPFSGQEVPAFVMEGDRFGEAIRRPGQVRPWLKDAILCSNHHLAYGADPDAPGKHFGRSPSFSSQWRYEAGMHQLEGWDRTDRRVGTAEMRALLQTAAHGTTEYSIITRPNALEFDVAVASMESELWDAPYREWTKFEFEEVFDPRLEPQHPEFAWIEEDTGVALRAGDQIVWRFDYQSAPKPFFHPVAPVGGPTTTLNSPGDHVWHHGIWFSWKYINGVNYWEHNRETKRPVGQTAVRYVATSLHSDHSASFLLHLDYAPSTDSAPVLRERRNIQVSSPAADGSYTIDWSARFEALTDDVTLQRTPIPGEPGGKANGGYAGLGFRLAELDNKRAIGPDGPLTYNDSNRIRERLDAFEFQAEFGGRPAGLAVSAHPSTYDAPSPWYSVCVRNISFFMPAAICFAPPTLQKGEGFDLYYRIHVHNGHWTPAQLRQAHAAYAATDVTSIFETTHDASAAAREHK